MAPGGRPTLPSAKRGEGSAPSPCGRSGTSPASRRRSRSSRRRSWPDLASRSRRPITRATLAAPIAYPSPGEFLTRAIVFGLLVVAGIAAIVLAGAWWAACIAAVGLLLAVAGLVVSVVALLGDERS